MSTVDLFSAGRIGAMETPNRIVMAPMTRARASAEGVPSELAIEYYSQRAGAGLILTEGTAPSSAGYGYARTPAAYSPPQMAAWRKIVDAVHARGGHIFLQLMHVGRIAHSANRLTPERPVAPSAVRAAGQMWTDTQGLQPNDEPRALETHEIAGVIEEFAQATRNGLEAGFDGVELHSASGYLPMQFLSTGSNLRTDGYGGSVQNRVRFVFDSLQAMIAAAGTAAKVGIKISPAMPFNDITDENPTETYTVLAQTIAPLGLAYLHAMQSPTLPGTLKFLRDAYPGTLLAGGGFDLTSAREILARGGADFVVFGKDFIANPDLPIRLEKGLPLSAPDPATFYTPGAKGYSDYPAASAS